MMWPSSCSIVVDQDIEPRSGRRSVRSSATTPARVTAARLPRPSSVPNQTVRVMPSTAAGLPASRSLVAASAHPSRTGLRVPGVLGRYAVLGAVVVAPSYTHVVPVRAATLATEALRTSRPPTGPRAVLLRQWIGVQ